MANRTESNAKIAANLDRHFALQRWAWQQQISPEEKLVLLHLVTGGEAAPEPAKIQSATCIGARAVLLSIERLQQRGLIDSELKPVGP